MRPSEEEKERFLDYIRKGDDRATAAWRINPDFSGSMFRSMCNPHSPRNYDANFAEAYDDAVAERGPLDPNRQQVWAEEGEAQRREESTSMTLGGYTKASHLSTEQIEEFLDLVREGTQAYTAAHMLDPPTSMGQINRRAAKDPEFAREFREAKEEGHDSFKDSLRSEAVRQAFAGDYRALKDQMIMHLEEAKPLTTNRHEVSGFDGQAIRILAERHFSDLPPEMLDAMIQELEKRELGQIGPPA